MSKVFTSKQFIEKLKWLANDVPNVYHSGKGWSTLNSKGQWQFDCILSIKCILWGFKADKNKFRGGTDYKSNGVRDFPCNAIYEVCTDVSKDFSKLVPGEYLCMKDTKHNHAGIYIGNGKVFEDTTGWGVNRAIISEIDSKGNRYYKGKKNCYWTYHGKLNYIDYSDEPQPTPTPTNKWRYQSRDMKKGYWLPVVYVGSNDYAGNKGNPMDEIRAENIELRAHDYDKKKWLPSVKSFSDCAGNYRHKMDALAARSLDPNVKIRYRVQLVSGRILPWVTGYNINDSKNGYAGNLGEPISCVWIDFLK